MPGMRIAVLSRFFIANGGGAERYAIKVVEELAAQNEVHVFAQHISHSYPGVRYHRLPWGVRRPRWVNQLLFSYQVWRETRTGFDIVHSHENVWNGNVQAVHVLPAKHGLFNGRTGLSLWVQRLRVATSPRLLTYLWLERMRFAPGKGRRIVAASAALAAAMQQVYPESAKSMAVITPGVDMPASQADLAQEFRTQAREALGLPVSGTCVLFIGNDFRKKGLPALIQAFASLRDLEDGLFVAVAGNPAQREAMLVLAHELGVADRIFFLGALAHMDSAYRAAHYLVHPTLQDSYAMVVLEAMAYGLPVIVSAPPYCGIADDLTDGENALLIADPQNERQIAAHLRAVHTDVALREKLIGNGLAFAQRHSWKVAGAAHAKLYAEVLA